MQRTRRSRSSSLIILMILIAILGVGWWQRVTIYDQIRLYNYSPSTEIIALADHTTMKSSTRRLFYVNHPSIEDKSKFNTDCTASEQTIVLGCYVSGKGIYLYRIDDPRLDGVEEVTAAHETLHAAYDRLSNADRMKVDQMTAQAFSQVTDERIKKTVEAYRAKDPSVVPNELHSILGTEVRNLPVDLEQYYSRYFRDRSAIVGYSEKYQQVFTDRQNQITAYDAQLKSMKQQIDQLNDSLDSQESSLTNQKDQMDRLLANKQYDEYNAQVSTFNAKVRQYNAQVSSDQNLIDRYNQLVAKRNALALEETQLVKAIDSRPSTVQTQ